MGGDWLTFSDMEGDMLRDVSVRRVCQGVAQTRWRLQLLLPADVGGNLLLVERHFRHPTRPRRLGWRIAQWQEDAFRREARRRIWDTYAPFYDEWMAAEQLPDDDEVEDD